MDRFIKDILEHAESRLKSGLAIILKSINFAPPQMRGKVESGKQEAIGSNKLLTIRSI